MASFIWGAYIVKNVSLVKSSILGVSAVVCGVAMGADRQKIVREIILGLKAGQGSFRR